MQHKLDLLSKKQNMSYELLTIRPSLTINTQIIERTKKNGITRRKNDKEMITIKKKQMEMYKIGRRQELTSFSHGRCNPSGNKIARLKKEKKLNNLIIIMTGRQ